MNIRPASHADIPQMMVLIEEHARRGDLLPRTADSVRETLGDWLVGVHEDGGIIACVSLLFYTPILAEVRSLVVADRAKGGGWGSAIVKALIVQARQRGVPTLFALTRAVTFFVRMGFTITSKDLFPEKVYRDCIHCPIFDNCDETAVVMRLQSSLPVDLETSEQNIIRAAKAARTQTLKPTAQVTPIDNIKVTQPARRPFTKKEKVEMSKPDVKKVVLAYSGGLDTSVIVRWLIENYKCEVICLTADIGESDQDYDKIIEKGLASGASKVIVKDLRHEFANDFLLPMMQSGAKYEREYLLGSSIARPLIAKWQVLIAEQEGADAVAHGCTGKGNDQVRFELTYKALNPALKVIAPWREWTIRSREDAIDYCEEFNIPITHSKASIYSRDGNLWHMSHEGGLLEDPSLTPEESMYLITNSPENAPDEPEEVKIEFEKGLPISVNDVKLPPAQLIQTLNKLGSKHGIGRLDLVENRLVGMKSHGVYETPGGTILYAAHRELESLCLDRDSAHFKEMVALRYAELVYFGKWYHPLRESIQAFVESTQETVTGWVKLKLYKGNMIVLGRNSDYSLYREDYATFGQEDVYDQKDAVGFITLFGLQMKVKAMMEMSDGGKTRYASIDYSKFKRD